jgi:hypothetical protein
MQGQSGHLGRPILLGVPYGIDSTTARLDRAIRINSMK